MKIIFNDAPREYQIGIQEEMSPISSGIYDLHDKLMYYLIIILFFVFSILLYIIISSPKFSFKYATHSIILEIIWTLLPAIILIIIAIPSFKLLYSFDEIINPLWVLIFLLILILNLLMI